MKRVAAPAQTICIVILGVFVACTDAPPQDVFAPVAVYDLIPKTAIECEDLKDYIAGGHVGGAGGNWSLSSPTYCSGLTFDGTAVTVNWSYTVFPDYHETVHWIYRAYDTEGNLVQSETDIEGHPVQSGETYEDEFSVPLVSGADRVLSNAVFDGALNEDSIDMRLCLSSAISEVPEDVGIDSHSEVGGVTLSWSDTRAAGSVQIHRRADGGAWSRVGSVLDTQSNTFTDSSATDPSVVYEYKLRYIHPNGCNRTRKGAYSDTESSSLGGHETLTISIWGPSQVASNDVCTWWVEASGGQQPYSYEWYRGTSKSGVLVGSSITYEGNTGSSDFSLRAKVSSTDGQIVNQWLHVDVHDPTPSCSV